MRNLTTSEFKELLKSKPGKIIDVRTKGEFLGGHLTGCRNLDFMNGEFNSTVHELDKSEVYYLYCASGNRSGAGAKYMDSLGFSEVYNIGGFQDLAQAGIEVEF